MMIRINRDWNLVLIRAHLLPRFRIVARVQTLVDISFSLEWRSSSGSYVSSKDRKHRNYPVGFVPEILEQCSSSRGAAPCGQLPWLLVVLGKQRGRWQV